MQQQNVGQKTQCFHCGLPCKDEEIVFEEKSFCCSGCQLVYQVLSDHGMQAYYQYDSTPGATQKNALETSFDYLDDQEIVDKLVSFKEGNTSRVQLDLPQIHCSSCLWLLENLSRFNPGIQASKVDFSAKKATIIFDHTQTSLRQLVELLSRIGYEPRLHFDQLDEEKTDLTPERSLLYKLGLAGFAFGNVMLLSFPEYLGFEHASRLFFLGYINIALATPVLVYSGWDYLKSAWKSIKINALNIDVPIAIGMLTLYIRSVYDILSGSGEGFLDSFTGFVFFLLIGRWFQVVTYRSLDFSRNYKSYFPISTSVKVDDKWATKSIDKLVPGDILLIRHEQIIPADSILTKGKARVDYSFVTGEANLISKNSGDLLFAGGKQNGSSIEVVVQKSVDHSYLTQLWNDDVFRKNGTSSTSHISQVVSKYFTYVILVIALATFLYWFQHDLYLAINAFTSVLIVACPCALALSIPFTYGHVLRMLSKEGFYLKNTETIEQIQDIDELIFDKTGTITDQSRVQVRYEGKSLSDQEEQLIRSACTHSSHPLSRAIAEHLKDIELVDVDRYEEKVGQGIIAEIDNQLIRIGSSAFIFGTKTIQDKGVFVEIDGQFVGQFHMEHQYRGGLEEVLDNLGKEHQISILSGDTDAEKDRIAFLIGTEDRVYFQQKPSDKLNHIRNLQTEGKHIMMIGDGLNDAGALKQSEVGIVIAQDHNNFSPACDAILSADSFSKFSSYIRYIKRSKWIIFGAFALAFVYNAVGLSFAVTGNLSPVIAAILMPLSSISVVVYGVLSSFVLFKFSLKK